MNTDSVFTIGSSHKVCEDYTASGTLKDFNVSWAALSDGCSSSPQVDFGARLLVGAARKHIWDLITSTNGLLFNSLDNELYYKPIIRYLEDICKSLKYDINCLDATLLTAVSKKQKTKIVCWGDGTIVIKKKDGTAEVIDIEASNGYPSYLSYHFYHARIMDMRRAEKNIIIRTYHLDNSGINYMPEIALQEFFTPYVITLDTQELEFVLLMSDGVQSFYNTDPNDYGRKARPVHFMTIVKELMAFKNFQGEFVQRRFNKVLKEANTNKWEHYDDLSVAGIFIGK